MTPLYPDGVYAPLPRFSKKTQTNIAPSATRNTASARCSRDAPIISIAWSSKGSLLFPCFGEPSPRYSPRHVHSGSSHRFYALLMGVTIGLAPRRDGRKRRVEGWLPGAEYNRGSLSALEDWEPRAGALTRGGAGGASATISPGRLSLDTAGRFATLAGVPLEFPRRELCLLELL